MHAHKHVSSRRDGESRCAQHHSKHARAQNVLCTSSIDFLPPTPDFSREKATTWYPRLMSSLVTKRPM